MLVDIHMRRVLSLVVFCAQYGVCNGVSVVLALRSVRETREGEGSEAKGLQRERGRGWKGIGITEGYRGMRVTAERMLDEVAEERKSRREGGSRTAQGHSLGCRESPAPYITADGSTDRGRSSRCNRRRVARRKSRHGHRSGVAGIGTRVSRAREPSPKTTHLVRPVPEASSTPSSSSTSSIPSSPSSTSAPASSAPPAASSATARVLHACRPSSGRIEVVR